MTKKSLYVHIPFCDHICGYCDFVRVGYLDSLADKYLIELRKDLQQIEGPVSSIYIGGGTPSSLSVDQLDLLFDSLNHLINDQIEITCEANPESLTEEKIIKLKALGVNRISLGVQSTQDEFLKKLGRLHSYQDVLDVIALLAKHGLANVSLDFIYGVPNQKLEDLENDLKQIINLNPNHISLYSLTIEPNSEFGRLNVKEVEPSLETAMYEMIQETLTQAGYDHYEISNFCKENYQSKHNLGYWHYDDFIGVGIGASSKNGNTRMTNASNLNDYLNGERNYLEVTQLSDQDLIFEHLMMSLRLREGINIESFNKKHKINLLDYYQDQINHFVKRGLLLVSKTHLKASDNGRLMLHDILVEFMA